MTLRGNGVPRTAYSDEQGTFELAGVAPGTYTLRVSLAGFSDATVENVTVSGAPLALPPVELQLASFGDTVVVTASRNEDRLCGDGGVGLTGVVGLLSPPHAAVATTTTAQVARRLMRERFIRMRQRLTVRPGIAVEWPLNRGSRTPVIPVQSTT